MLRCELMESFKDIFLEIKSSYLNILKAFRLVMKVTSFWQSRITIPISIFIFLVNSSCIYIKKHPLKNKEEMTIKREQASQKNQNTSLKKISQQLIDEKPDIIYFSDTNHSDLKLTSTYTTFVEQIVKIAPEYNCIFIEADQKIFQPEINSFMSGEKSYQDSVAMAQKYWESLKITHTPYKQAPEPLLNKIK